MVSIMLVVSFKKLKRDNWRYFFGKSIRSSPRGQYDSDDDRDGLLTRTSLMMRTLIHLTPAIDLIWTCFIFLSP